MFLILNVSGLWIYHVSKYAGVTQGFEYARVIPGGVRKKSPRKKAPREGSGLGSGLG